MPGVRPGSARDRHLRDAGEVRDARPQGRQGASLGEARRLGGRGRAGRPDRGRRALDGSRNGVPIYAPISAILLLGRNVEELIQLVEKGYEAWNSGDRGWVLDHMSENIEWIPLRLRIRIPAPTEAMRGSRSTGRGGAPPIGQLHFKIEEILDAGKLGCRRRPPTGARTAWPRDLDRVIWVFQFEDGECVRVHEVLRPGRRPERDPGRSRSGRCRQPSRRRPPDGYQPRADSARAAAQAALKMCKSVRAGAPLSRLGLFGSAEFPFVAGFPSPRTVCSACSASSPPGTSVQNGWATNLVVMGHALIVAALLGMLAFASDGVAGTFGEPIGTDLKPDAAALDLGGGASWSRSLKTSPLGAAGSATASSTSGPPTHAMAMAEVLVVGPDEAMTPEEVAAGIDDYLNSFSARGKWRAAALSALTVYPLFRLRPPFAMISAGLDIPLSSVVRRDVIERLPPPAAQAHPGRCVRSAQQLAIIGYYADPRTARDQPATRRSSKRKRYAKRSRSGNGRSST